MLSAAERRAARKNTADDPSHVAFLRASTKPGKPSNKKPLNFKGLLHFIGLCWIVKWWRRTYNSLSNPAIIQAYFFEILRHTPDSYPRNAGCGEALLDLFGLLNATTSLVEPAYLECADRSGSRLLLLLFILALR
jgi:hypothetical protein